MIPAYAKTLLAMRREGLRPPGVIYVTDAWWIAEKWKEWDRFCLVVRSGVDYDMSCVRGLDVTLQKTGNVAKVGQAILAAEPRTFWVHDVKLDRTERLI